MALVKTLGWAVWFFAYLVTRLPLYWRVLWLVRQNRLEERDALVARQVEKWASRLLHHIKMEVEVTGLENLPAPGQVVMFASNHQSYLDIPVILANILPPHPLVAKKEIGQVPFLGGWMRQLGCVFIDREDARANVAAMRRATEELKAGRSMIIFPEGTRSRSGELGEFMAGAVRIAQKAEVPIVPVAINGTHKGLEGNGWRIQPARVTMHILPAVPTQGLDRPAQKALPARLREMIAEAMG